MSKDSYLRASERRLNKGVPWLRLGLVISLGLNTYLLTRMEHQARDVAEMEQLLQSEIKGLRDSSSSAFAAFQVDQQRFYEMKQALETAAIKTPNTAPPDGAAAQPEDEHTHSLQARTIQTSQQLTASQLEAKHHSDTKIEETVTTIRSMGPQAQDTSASLEGVSAKPIMPSAKLATTDTLIKVEQVSNPFESRVVSDSKRTDGAERASAVANKLAAPPAGKEENERDYFDLDLVKDKTGQTFGDVRIALKKSDLKHNRCTLTIFADDKVVEKKDQAINEPVQVYVSVSTQPYEIVIKQIKRDEVIGSLAVPKTKTPPKASTNAASL
jgi:hypothetical protein